VLLLLTEDGSHSLKDERTGETYHSIHGAVQESRHIFIGQGLQFALQKELNVFEVGFGTGLNACLTWIEAEKKGINIAYTTVELFPVEEAVWEQLNYVTVLSDDSSSGMAAKSPISFQQLHSCSWGTFHTLSPHFTFRKLQVDFSHYSPDRQYDLVYFDAFSPEKQPELWTNERFETLAQHCNPGAILTTYCAKGTVKQALREAGFTVERLQGPPGKRHMLRGMRK